MLSKTLPSRLIKIFHYILENDFITADMLSEKVNKSFRTVRNDIKILNEELAKDNLIIKNVRNRGYHIEALDDKVKNLVDPLLLINTMEVSEKNNLDTQERRVKYILKTLIYKAGYTKISDLADEIYVSTQTLNNDLKELRLIIKHFNISLENKPYHGIKLIGHEMDFRKCLLQLTYDNELDTQKYYSKEQIDALKTFLLKQFNKNGIGISDYNLRNLIFHIVISIIRINESHIIEKQASEDKNLNNEIFAEIINFIEKKFIITLPVSERVYIEKQILSKQIKAVSKNERYNVTASRIVGTFLDRINDEYGYNLKNDELLRNDLFMHFYSLIDRINTKLFNRNPMLLEIRKNFPFEYDMTFSCICFTLEHLNKDSVPADEIAFITLHIRAALERNGYTNSNQKKKVLIVCGTGIGTARLVEAKLKKDFGSALIANRILSKNKYDELKSIDEDFIISTIPIEVKDKPVIKINPIFSNNDKEKIEAVANDYSNSKTVLEKLFVSEIFILNNKNIRAKEDVIKKVCENLLKKKIVTKNYYNSVIQRENASSTALNNLIAIPHAIEESYEKSFVYAVILKNPIRWDLKQNVQLVLFLGIKKDDMGKIQCFYDALLNVVNNLTVVQKLLKSKDFYEFKNIMFSQIDGLDV